MSADVVFRSDKAYGQTAHCTDESASDEDARMFLEHIAHKAIPEEYWPKIRYGAMRVTHVDEDGKITDQPGCTIWWLYRQHDYVILNNDWPIRIEVEP